MNLGCLKYRMVAVIHFNFLDSLQSTPIDRVKIHDSSPIKFMYIFTKLLYQFDLVLLGIYLLYKYYSIKKKQTNDCSYN